MTCAESGAGEAGILGGDLQKWPVAMLLAGACERRGSGTFTFREGSRCDVLTMRAGRISSVHTSEPVAYLGSILYELGYIDARTLDATLLEIASAKRLHGDVLVERGAITPGRLEEGLVEQSFRKVQHLFTLSEAATWTFREDVDELAGARDGGRPAIDTWPAIWRGLRNHPVPVHVRRTLAKVEGGISLRDLKWVAICGLSSEEAALCERLHAQPSTLERLVATSPLVAERTEMLVYLLALARAIVRIETRIVGPAELGIEGVRERASRIRDEDPFTMLGLRADASAEAARAAYFRLARLWHPDKVPAALAEVRAECGQVFVQLAEAHRFINELSALRMVDDTATRRSLIPANDSVAPQAPTLRDADAALARGDLETARTIALPLTVAGTDGPSARAMMLWCENGAGTCADLHGNERALASLEKILTGDPECWRALFYRGQILKRLGRSELAVRDFKKVARLDPRNIDAQREVRLHEMRARSSAGDARGAPSSTDGTKDAATQSSPTSREEDSSVGSGLRRLLTRVAGR